MVNRFFPDEEEDIIYFESVEYARPARSPVYGVRSCPLCGEEIFGMPGSADAVCRECGYKDPCCSDY